MRALLLQPNVITWTSLTSACSLGAAWPIEAISAAVPCSAFVGQAWSQAVAVLAASKTHQELPFADWSLVVMLMLEAELLLVAIPFYYL